MKFFSEKLASIPLFAGIEAGRIDEILEQVGAYSRDYNKDEYIKYCGDPADFIGVILEGSIQILQDDFYGKRTITASLGEGSIFAEAFACSGIPSLPVDILSCSKSKILFLDRDKIMQTCHRECEFHHTLIGNLLRIVASKNMMLNKKLQYVSHKTTSEKIMAYLNDQAILHHSPDFTIPFNRQGLADYLGVERSAMSAEISKLVKQGYIETKREYFKLLRPLG